MIFKLAKILQRLQNLILFHIRANGSGLIVALFSSHSLYLDKKIEMLFLVPAKKDKLFVYLES
jgi:hypothetical protein